MHLKQLKLAGFKSFVEPTVVHFPSPLVAVVGPNGCGKSNLIDAVLWVMGESSAKNLRGTTMTDVIFNGSANRKSLGQASVELVFDNSLGRLGGPFASYGEIALKRLVTRDGTSAYYLNGSPCRRRDITDIFLGTGAGARGYSIIGQGTISRIIESKPAELRLFLEEAAGVSQYKERRRETLSRIEQSRENMLRLTDLREELNKQLQRLSRQAKAARRYAELKAEEQAYKVDILVLKWQALHQQALQLKQQSANLEIQLLQENTTLAQLQAEEVVINEALHAVSERIQTGQAALYQTGTDMARLEEHIAQQKKDNLRLAKEKEALHQDQTEATVQLQKQQLSLDETKQNLTDYDTGLQSANQLLQEKMSTWHEAQATYSSWSSAWQKENQDSSNLQAQIQVGNLKLQHANASSQQLALRIEKLQKEQSNLSLDDLIAQKEALQNNEWETAQAQDKAALDAIMAKAKDLRLEADSTEQHIHQLQDNHHDLHKQQATLSGLLQALMETKDQEDLPEPRLMAVLQVETKWQLACERVLGKTLSAYVFSEDEALWQQKDKLEQQANSAVTLRKKTKAKGPFPSLADAITGDIPGYACLLESIFTADSLEQALEWLPQIQLQESIVTASGIWLGQGFMHCPPLVKEETLGVLALSEKIASLATKLSGLQGELVALKSLRDKQHEQLKALGLQKDEAELGLQSSKAALEAHKAALVEKDRAIEAGRLRARELTMELETLLAEVEEAARASMQHQAEIEKWQAEFQMRQAQEQQRQKEKQGLEGQLQSANQALEIARGQVHQIELQKEKVKQVQVHLEDSIQQIEAQLRTLQDRLNKIEAEQSHSSLPEESLQAQLTLLIAQHQEQTTLLDCSKEEGLQCKERLDALHHNLQKTAACAKKLQEDMTELHLAEQANRLRTEAIEASLAEYHIQPQTEAEAGPDKTETACEEALLQIASAIAALGAINLAAIEEYEQEEQRKNHLDEQCQDLEAALATLETAITQMDKETRLRLENTFEAVNTFFKSLFPRLFGGGSAQLEWTSDNPLEAGVLVIAQPPGKRNSSIQLLSGGEKALTAVALVFALFQLNPSPFCMLDEVDAPLDDVNTGRFCDLVKEMSQCVQFLFITHNKVTMEMADHLIGVTMREPGVSRLVSVDVKQALTEEQ